MQRAAKKIQLVFFITALLCDRATAVSLEAEDGTYTGSTVQRGAASGRWTVRLGQGQYVQNLFLTQCSCSVTVTNVVYTNDGGSDMVTVSVDGRIVGTFRTLSRSGGGHLWNVPRSSGRVGSSVELSPGRHRIRITATSTDRYLVEIDRVVLTLNCGGGSSCPNPTSMTTPTIAPTTSATTSSTMSPTMSPTTTTVTTLEAEDGMYTGSTAQRGAASGQLTVRLGQGQYVENPFVTRCSCSVTVTNVVYTNDGGTDVVTVSVDGRIVGTFLTLSRSGGGHLWNVPRSSGRVGSSVELSPGRHRVRITATSTDRYLVEIDRVVLTLNCGGGSSSCPNPTSMTTPTIAPAVSPINTTMPNTVSLEAEDGTYTGRTVQRGAASGQLTVQLRQGQYIENAIPARCICSTVEVVNVIYTNDGRSDTLTVSVDGRPVGTFHTLSRSGGGHLWNVPRSSGRIGRSVMLGHGTHRLRITATRTDRYRVEIDRVILKIRCDSSWSCRTRSDSQGRPAAEPSSGVSKASVGWVFILAALLTLFA